MRRCREPKPAENAQILVLASGDRQREGRERL